MNNTSVKSKSKDNGNDGLIGGMNREAASKFVEARRKVDNKLCQLTAQGHMLSALSEANDFDLVYMVYIGDTIREIVEEIYNMLDCYVPWYGVQKELEKTDKSMDKA